MDTPRCRKTHVSQAPCEDNSRLRQPLRCNRGLLTASWWDPCRWRVGVFTRSGAAVRNGHESGGWSVRFGDGHGRDGSVRSAPRGSPSVMNGVRHGSHLPPQRRRHDDRAQRGHGVHRDPRRRGGGDTAVVRGRGLGVHPAATTGPTRVPPVRAGARRVRGRRGGRRAVRGGAGASAAGVRARGPGVLRPAVRAAGADAHGRGRRDRRGGAPGARADADRPGGRETRGVVRVRPGRTRGRDRHAVIAHGGPPGPAARLRAQGRDPAARRGGVE